MVHQARGSARHVTETVESHRALALVQQHSLTALVVAVCNGEDHCKDVDVALVISLQLPCRLLVAARGFLLGRDVRAL
jgi:hypothetical protein